MPGIDGVYFSSLIARAKTTYNTYYLHCTHRNFGNNCAMTEVYPNTTWEESICVYCSNC